MANPQYPYGLTAEALTKEELFSIPLEIINTAGANAGTGTRKKKVNLDMLKSQEFAVISWKNKAYANTCGVIINRITTRLIRNG